MHQIIEEDCKRIIQEISIDAFNNIAQKNILLTGSCGFLGAYFMYSVLYANKTILKNKEANLYAIDNFIRGKPSWLGDFEGNDFINVIEYNIVENVPPNLPNINFVIHAASIASPIYYRQFPIETMDANVIGVRNLLDYALENKASMESFLYFSSSEIYGNPDPKHIPTNEDYWGNVSCIGPRACYDESKRYGETLCVNFYRVHQIPIKIVRPFNNYGPRLKITDKRVIPDFFRNLLNKEDIVLLSDGSPTRTFCYISDAIIGYWKALLSNFNGEIFNIGNDKPEISMLELAKLIVKIGKKQLDINIDIKCQESDDFDYLTDVPNRRCPDITKAKTLLDYTPKVSLEEGLTRTLQWYQDNREI